MALESVLRRHYTPATRAGGGAISADLKRDLKRYGNAQAAAYSFLFVAVVGLFLVSAYATWRWLHEPQQLATLVGALGISVGGAFEMMRRVAREWGRVSLVLMLLQHADEDRAQMLVDELLASMRG